MRQLYTSAPVITAAALCLSLAACAHAPPLDRVVTQRVDVPVFQPCKPEVGPEPVYPTMAGPLPRDIYVQMQTLLAERDLRIARDLEKSAALAGCAGE